MRFTHITQTTSALARCARFSAMVVLLLLTAHTFFGASQLVDALPAPATASASTSLPVTAPGRYLATLVGLESQPSSTSPVVSVAAPTRTVAARLTASRTPAAPRLYMFPVQPANVASFGKYHHDYPATDIFCPIGSLFVAPTNGVVNFISTVDTWDPRVDDPATRGGRSVAIIGDDGVRYYGAHLTSVQPGIVPGVRVKVGQTLGRTGRSGDARYTAPHLHFGISPPTPPADWKGARGRIPPYNSLLAGRAGSPLRPALK